MNVDAEMEDDSGSQDSMIEYERLNYEEAFVPVEELEDEKTDAAAICGEDDLGVELVLDEESQEKEED